jgi:hypothetical protein
MAYSPTATREHRRRQREGKLLLRIEVDEADLIATLRLAGFIAEHECDPEPAELAKLLEHVIALWASTCGTP